jgi:hypothetical protein
VPTLRDTRRPLYASMVDHLAMQMSEKTGTAFTVLRPRIPEKLFGKPTGRMITRYSLMAQRADQIYIFFGHRNLNVREMKSTLSTMLDRITRGFIPLHGQMTLEEAVSRQTERHSRDGSIMEPLSTEEEISFGEKVPLKGIDDAAQG